MRSTVVGNGTAALVAETVFAFASEVGFSVDDPMHVDVLERGEESSVYRLSWRTPRRGSCILKQCATDRGRRERTMYEKVVSELSVATLRYFGSRDDRNRSVWLVLEDAGDTELSLEAPGVRALLSEWVAQLHMEASQLTVRQLPDAGPAHFAYRLAEAEAQLTTRLGDEALDEDDRDILARCLERCGELNKLWALIEETCSGFPRTLVHGDLVEENLRLIPIAGGQRLVPLDWEMAGYGVPAVDLVHVDPELYWERTSRWLGSSRREFDRLLLVGRIFHALVHQWADMSMDEVERAEARLAELLTHGAWTESKSLVGGRDESDTGSAKVSGRP